MSATDRNSQTDHGFSRIGSDYDQETADLVGQLLATGYTTTALCVALTIDDDTLRRWRRGVRASHMARKFMRAVLLLRVIAPGPLVCLSTYTPAELRQAADWLAVRHLTPQDVAREAVTAEQRRAAWRDGAA
jgi:transposase-like protein